MTTNTDNRPALMQKLDGHWLASGDIMGKPVQYNVVTAPALQGQFTEISMNDVQVPSQYEARVFIGFDSAANQIIAHWLDSFGAQYSIPHGTGSISQDTIEFIVPYPTSSFKDKFTYHPESDTWTLEITAQQPDGAWEHFAMYSFTRIAPLPLRKRRQTK
jgi:hypothetical protein